MSKYISQSSIAPFSAPSHIKYTQI